MGLRKIVFFSIFSTTPSPKDTLLFNKDLSYTTKQIIILSTIIYAVTITAYSIQFASDDGCTIKNEYKDYYSGYHLSIDIAWSEINSV